MPYKFNPFTNNFDYYSAVRSLVNGSFQESFNALVTSDGVTITMSLEQSGTGDLTMQFSDGDSTLDCTPAATIELTAGTDASPQANYIYIPQSTKVLTKSTSDWPTSAEHIKVAYFYVPSATYVQGDGCYVNQNWNDHLAGTDNMGHLLHIAERSRRDGAYYFSGVGPNGTDQDTNTSYFDYVSGTEAYITIASGVIFQMHRHMYTAKDSRTNDIHVVNWNGDAFHDINDLTDITADANGNSLNNKFFNLTLWGVANKTGEYAPIMINLPTGSYNSLANAEGDVDGHDVLSIPREFNLDSSTGFLIARLTMRIQASNWSHQSTVDLRGTTPSTVTGGVSGTTTEFADNQFAIFDEADSTKILNFDTGTLITTGNTRTLQIPDSDGVIALVGDVGFQKRWIANGPYQVGTTVDGAFISDSAWTITGVWLWRGTAGSASSTIVDLNKNGTTMYTTQGNRPTIAFDDGDNKVDCTLPDDTAVAAGDIITIDIDQIESGTPKDLILMVEGY